MKLGTIWVYTLDTVINDENHLVFNTSINYCTDFLQFKTIRTPYLRIETGFFSCLQLLKDMLT